MPCPTVRHLENEFYPNAVNIIRAIEKMLGLEPTDLSQEDFYSYEKKFYSDLLENTNFIHKNEEYEKSPIKIIVDPTHNQATYLPYYIEFIDENSFQIYTKSQKS